MLISKSKLIFLRFLGSVVGVITPQKCSKGFQHLPRLYTLFKLFINPNVECLPRESTSLHIICLIKFKEEMFQGTASHHFPSHSMPWTLMRT